jgi:hypothetical protein
LLLLQAGCACSNPLTRTRRAVASAAAPLLALVPDADWTASYNQLIDLGPRSVRWLVEHPRMQRRSAPDDLRLMVHLSLLNMLAHPATKPRLTIHAFETRDGVLFFEPKVAARGVGQVHLLTAMPPVSWLDLYPADFDHALAKHVDLEGDRQAMLAWYALRADQPDQLATWMQLAPQLDTLWRVLSERPADRWTYSPEARTIRVAWRQDASPLFDVPTYDYNLVRAACIQLGMSEDAGVQSALIEAVTHPSGVVAHNARFALQFSPDPAIRRLIEGYDDRGPEPLIDARAGIPRRIPRNRRAWAPASEIPQASPLSSGAQRQ